MLNLEEYGDRTFGEVQTLLNEQALYRLHNYHKDHPEVATGELYGANESHPEWIAFKAYLRQSDELGMIAARIGADRETPIRTAYHVPNERGIRS